VLTELIDLLGLAGPWTYLLIFLGVSLLMVWRLEAMLDSGLKGTALGTLLMPLCSGLGNLIFVYLMVQKNGPPAEVLTNCLVNNVTNLTLLLGLPAACWGLVVIPSRSVAPGRRKKMPPKKKAAGAENQINRLSMLLTLAAVFFFTGAVWIMGRDGQLDQTDGKILIGLFLFWQCFQVFEVMKNNIRERVSLGWQFYLDVLAVLACAYAMFGAIDWIVNWLSSRKGGFIGAQNLGWLTGWLMVLPNAILAMYWGWKRRADVVYTSQIGDGHICIPLCLGLFAFTRPMSTSGFTEASLALLLGAAAAQAIFLILLGGLPRWAGGILIGSYGWYVWAGLA
jgi:cation:H+ antiporter